MHCCFKLPVCVEFIYVIVKETSKYLSLKCPFVIVVKIFLLTVDTQLSERFQWCLCNQAWDHYVLHIKAQTVT